MNRGLLGLLLLILFLGLGLWGSIAMAKFHKPLSAALEQAAVTALKGDLETAATAAKKAQTAWESRWNRVAMLADHSPMDEIDAHFSRLEMYALAGNAEDFAACANQLAAMIAATAEAHQLNLQNLL